MNKGPLDDLFEEVLREGDTNTLWAMLDPDALSSPVDNTELFSDPQLSEALDRFLEKNRFPIATAHSRCMLRRICSGLKELMDKRTGRKSTVTTSQETISLSGSTIT